MKDLKTLLSYYKSPVFLLKGNKIIAFNEEFNDLCSDIEKIDDFRTLFNRDPNIIIKLASTRQIVECKNEKLYIIFIKFKKPFADYLVSFEKIDEKSDSGYVDLFKEILRLGYLFIDLNENKKIKKIYLPSFFIENYKIDEEIDFIKKYIPRQDVKSFQKEIDTLFSEKKLYFNFNTKIKYQEDKELFIQLRCFVNPLNNNQLLCSTLEYSDLNKLQANLADTELSLLELYENIIDPIVIIDTEKIISFNNAAKIIAKFYNIELFDNLNMNLLIQNEKRKEFLLDTKNHKKRIEDSFLLPNGKKIYFNYTIIPIIIKNQKFYTLIFRDRTKTQNLLDKIKTSEKRYDEILNSVSDGIILTDNLVIEFWNKSAEKITGFSKEEMLGESIYKMFQNRYENEEFNDFNKFKDFSLGNQEVLNIEKRIKTKNGDEKIVKISISTYTNSKGEQKAVGVFSDVTEKYLIQEEIKKKRDELKEVNTALKSFFSILAHDMRTPVIQMLSLTELLLDDFDDFSKEEQKKYLSMLQLSSKNGLELLDTLVEWGRTMTNKITIEPLNFNIDEIIEKAIRVNSSQSEAKNISVVFSPYERYVYADSKMVFTILNNIISNAIKFSYKNSKFIIKTENIGDKIKISVQDFGKGIKDTGNIFLYNKKNIELGTENEKGKGIGLMFTAELVKKNNGEMWVESKLDEGSTFYFTLPKGEKNAEL